MGGVLKKRKKRTNVPKIKKKHKVLRHGDKRINIGGNALIAENWDKNQTLIQNYRRLGLATRLNAPTGGVEKKITDAGASTMTDSLHITSSTTTGGKGQQTKLQPEEVQVERDPKTGKILRVVHNDQEDKEVELFGRKRRKDNPLNDPLDDLPEPQEMEVERPAAETEFIRQLEARVAQEEEALKHRKPRHQSQREQEWIQRLVEKHGDNIQAMVRDRKLNPFQQSEGDLRRRIRKWRESQAQAQSQSA